MCFVDLLDIDASMKHVHMSPTLNGSLAIRRFKHSNAIKIHDRMLSRSKHCSTELPFKGWAHMRYVDLSAIHASHCMYEPRP